MQSARINNRLPQVYRFYKAAPATNTTTRNMSFFPRFVTNEFAPMFRLMDDYASHVATRSAPHYTSTLRNFQPKFDVKETKDSYELHGELPGIDQKDINIEFTDGQTLSIKGHTEKFREEGTRPAEIDQEPAEQDRITEGTATPDSNYHKASVEDESGNAQQDNAEATKEDSQVAQQQKQQTPTSRYWVSERSVGNFARTFAFPDRIDQDNVKASLKNGILSVVVPKAAAPVARRINVE